MFAKPAIVALAASAVALVAIVTALLIPAQTNPAYAVGEAFVKAASRGDEAQAQAQVSAALRAYAADHCPQGSIAACIAGYTPPDWGGFLNAVYRRSQPDGPDAWDIQYIATYAENEGFSGVCIYVRTERTHAGWQVVRWAGWVSCGAPNAGLSALMQADAPNAAP